MKIMLNIKVPLFCHLAVMLGPLLVTTAAGQEARIINNGGGLSEIPPPSSPPLPPPQQSQPATPSQPPSPPFTPQGGGGGGGGIRRPNGPPRLLPGGDLTDFVVAENSAPGTKIYTLRAEDPEGSPVAYFISGDYLSVDSKTGEITLRQSPDREKTTSLEVVITLQDQPVGQAPENLVPIRKTIPVLDRNDNPPQLSGGPYNFTVKETEAVGQTLYSSILITDADLGRNAEITVRCTEESSQDACDTFEVFAEKREEGKYVGLVILKKQLDYETLSSYHLVLEASDQGEDRTLTSSTAIFIQVEDIQDQAPVFLNAPYSVTVAEGTQQDTDIFEVLVRDGDIGRPRALELSLEGDTLGYFKLRFIETSSDNVQRFVLMTTDNLLDREHPDILREGGLYIFQRAKKSPATTTNMARRQGPPSALSSRTWTTSCRCSAGTRLQSLYQRMSAWTRRCPASPWTSMIGTLA